jgi:hypothetical protein
VFSVIIVRIGLGIAIDPDTVQGSAAVHVKSIGGPAGRGLVNELSTFEASDGSNTVDGNFLKSDTKKSKGYSDDTSRHAKSDQDRLSAV